MNRAGQITLPSLLIGAAISVIAGFALIQTFEFFLKGSLSDLAKGSYDLSLAELKQVLRNKTKCAAALRGPSLTNLARFNITDGSPGTPDANIAPLGAILGASGNVLFDTTATPLSGAITVDTPLLRVRRFAATSPVAQVQIQMTMSRGIGASSTFTTLPLTIGVNSSDEIIECSMTLDPCQEYFEGGYRDATGKCVLGIPMLFGDPPPLAGRVWLRSQ